MLHIKLTRLTKGGGRNEHLSLDIFDTTTVIVGHTLKYVTDS